MTYTALAMVFVLVCVGLGAGPTSNAGATRLAAVLAAAMVAAQFYFLVLR